MAAAELTDSIKPCYYIRVRTTDQNGGTYEKMFNIVFSEGGAVIQTSDGEYRFFDKDGLEIPYYSPADSNFYIQMENYNRSCKCLVDSASIHQYYGTYFSTPFRSLRYYSGTSDIFLNFVRKIVYTPAYNDNSFTCNYIAGNVELCEYAGTHNSYHTFGNLSSYRLWCWLLQDYFSNNSTIEKFNGFLNVRNNNQSKVEASAYLINKKSDNDPYNNLVIIADGHDQGNQRNIVSLFRDMNPLLFSSTSAINDGYDVVFVDFLNGTGDINYSAKLFLRVVQYFAERATGPMYVGGGSMGGVVARLALLLAEKNNLPCLNKIKKFLAIDSPLQGAQGPFNYFDFLVNAIFDHPDGTVEEKMAEAMLGQIAEMLAPASIQMFFKNPANKYESEEHD